MQDTKSTKTYNGAKKDIFHVGLLSTLGEARGAPRFTTTTSTVGDICY